MSRYIITVTGQHRSDPDAIIGYDTALRTYFLQAFPHEITDEPALGLGTHHHAFEMLEDLHQAAIQHGYDFMPMPSGIAAKLSDDKAAASDRAADAGSLVEILKHFHPPD